MPIDFIINFSEIKAADLDVKELTLLSLGVGVERLGVGEENVKLSVERAIKKALFELMERTENINSNALLNVKIDYKVVPIAGEHYVIAVAYGTSAIAEPKVMRDDGAIRRRPL